MTELPMVCTCKKDGVLEVEERRLRIYKRMGLRHSFDLAEAIVMSLAFDFGCEADVDVDLWFGISFRTPLLGEGFQACDDPFDGFAAIWEACAEKAPERVTCAGQASAVHGSAVEIVSAALVVRYTHDEQRYRDHRAEKHDGPNDCPPCEDCEALLALMISSAHALSWEWGRNRLDECANAAFDR
ncbi:MAG TPA: hypothetical protein VFA98_15370 [Thermoanaerobaculia bacterium]|nr:hypothetical protein [Thermoanaerobaculia bacterium]